MANDIDLWNDLKELEQVAKERFIENSDWEAVLQMFDQEEREEYDRLTKEFHDKYIEVNEDE